MTRELQVVELGLLLDTGATYDAPPPASTPDAETPGPKSRSPGGRPWLPAKAPPMAKSQTLFLKPNPNACAKTPPSR